MKGRGDLIELVPWKGRAIEIGVNEGHNLLDWSRRRPDLILWGVDKWEWKFANSEPIARKALDGRATLVKATSLEASRGFDRPIFDLVYIDAHHEYASIYADICAWWPKVKVGGILSGHDYEMKPQSVEWEAIEVKQAVDDWAGKHGITVNVVEERCPSWWVRKVEE